MRNVQKGFGVTAKSTAEVRRVDPTGIVCFRQADVGEYLREVSLSIKAGMSDCVKFGADWLVELGGHSFHNDIAPIGTLNSSVNPVGQLRPLRRYIYRSAEVSSISLKKKGSMSGSKGQSTWQGICDRGIWNGAKKSLTEGRSLFQA